jgi:hypothetical protein
LRRFEGRPAAEEVAKDRGIFLLKPLQNLREIVFEGTGQTIGQPDFVADQTPAVFDELRQGAHGGALGGERGELVAVCEEAFDLAFGLGGVICGPARGTRFAVLGHGERLDGKEDEELICAQRGHERPLIALQAHRNRLAVEARVQTLDPRVDRFRTVFEVQKLPARGASGLQADIVFGIGPVEANKGGTCFGGLWLPVASPRVWYSRAKGQACVRSAKA